MPEPKTYALYLPSSDKISTFAPIGIFTLVGFLLVSGLLQNAKGEPPQFIGIFFLAMAGCFSYFVLSIPHKINVYNNIEIEFVSLIRKKRVSPTEIESIKPRASQIGFLLINTSHGKIRILNQFDDFHEFISNLKTNNPAIQLRGC